MYACAAKKKLNGDCPEYVRELLMAIEHLNFMLQSVFANYVPFGRALWVSGFARVLFLLHTLLLGLHVYNPSV